MVSVDVPDELALTVDFPLQVVFSLDVTNLFVEVESSTKSALNLWVESIVACLPLKSIFATLLLTILVPLTWTSVTG